eukprot:3879535-Pleurochrysis_carterae.AAC.2
MCRRERACACRAQASISLDRLRAPLASQPMFALSPVKAAGHVGRRGSVIPVSYTHLRAHETDSYL